MRKRTLTRRIRFDGGDSDFMYFSTPSWTRGSRITHEIRIEKRTGNVKCTCEDAVYRMKRGDVLDTQSPAPCKHVRRLLTSFARIIAEGIEVALTA